MYNKYVVPVLSGYISTYRQTKLKQDIHLANSTTSWSLEQIDDIIRTLVEDINVINNIFCMCSTHIPNPDIVKNIMLSKEIVDECLQYLRRF